MGCATCGTSEAERSLIQRRRARQIEKQLHCIDKAPIDARHFEWNIIGWRDLALPDLPKQHVPHPSHSDRKVHRVQPCFDPMEYPEELAFISTAPRRAFLHVITAFAIVRMSGDRDAMSARASVVADRCNLIVGRIEGQLAAKRRQAPIIGSAMPQRYAESIALPNAVMSNCRSYSRSINLKQSQQMLSRSPTFSILIEPRFADTSPSL